MLDRHHQLTGNFLHDHYWVIGINAIFLTILDGNGTQGMRVADSLQWHAWHAWNAGIRYKVQTHRNGMLAEVSCISLSFQLA